MAKITAELLREMVGVRADQRPLIDKLVGPLNLVLPAYGITTEYRIAAFLGTAAPECDWFKTLREYGKGAGRAYGKPAGPYKLIYYGRGIFQVTWLRNVRAFTEYVAENWETIKHRAAVYKWTVPPDFVKDIELLADPYWSVESACWYWKANHLQRWADKGTKGFFGLQGLVNRGSAEKEALHYNARLRAYETARRLIDDDFTLSAAASDAQTPTGNKQDEGQGSTSSQSNQSGQEQSGSPPTQNIHDPAQVMIGQYQGIGLIGVLKKDLTAVGGGNLSFQLLQEYATQASGWPEWVVSLIVKAATVLLVIGAVWALFRLIHYIVWKIGDWHRQRLDAQINSDVSRKNLEWIEWS